MMGNSKMTNLDKTVGINHEEEYEKLSKELEHVKDTTYSGVKQILLNYNMEKTHKEIALMILEMCF